MSTTSPKYPIYIISKGRWESRLTSKALEAMRVPYRIVIEPQEFDQYAAVIDPEKILQLPFSNLGQGSIPARNWVWEHSLAAGDKRHWILDDNISAFLRYHLNRRLKVTSGVCFRACEDLTDRYKNVALSGLQYEMFIPAVTVFPPVRTNIRIYSCILINNSISYRWRGRYNEDTDLSLRVLKDGWCTILVQGFLCRKMATMQMKGGNTESLYKLNGVDGRLLMAQSLQAQHPDVTKVTRKYDRWQHQVDYRPFKKNKLVLREGIKLPTKPNNYGMEIGKV